MREAFVSFIFSLFLSRSLLAQHQVLFAFVREVFKLQKASTKNYRLTCNRITLTLKINCFPSVRGMFASSTKHFIVIMVLRQ